MTKARNYISNKKNFFNSNIFKSNGIESLKTNFLGIFIFYIK